MFSEILRLWEHLKAIAEGDEKFRESALCSLKKTMRVCMSVCVCVGSYECQIRDYSILE